MISQKFMQGLLVVTLMCFGLFILFVLENFFHGKDDTDPAGIGRSGMGIYIDAGTGCQYLGVFHGGLTPRLALDGKQICRDQDRRK